MKFAWDSDKLQQKIIFSDNRGQNQWKWIKTGEGEKLWYLFLCNFWPLVPKHFFWKDDWVPGSASTYFWVFPIISEFPKILSLKLFSNLWGNLYTMLFALDFMYHCTCGESNHFKIWKWFIIFCLWLLVLYSLCITLVLPILLLVCLFVYSFVRNALFSESAL